MREQKGISQEKLAEHADLDRTYVSLLERGLRTPTLKTVFSMAEVLSVKPSAIMRELEETIGFKLH